MTPGDSEAEACRTLASELAAGMDDATVETCEPAALERFEVISSP
jgi:hypothetical protein